MENLASQHCQPEAALLAESDIPGLLQQLQPDWSLGDDGKTLQRSLRFDNYYQTLAMINAIAQIAHSQDHHPDICFGYNQCHISWSTHSAGGITANDFICAAKIDLVTSI